ncbi:flavin reductase family protein [Shouchella shacheensis]|uniref:flavin reductase family protein n=1 Tax=Shouchella shacheensis TaxID=1649580 RepID=UPI00073FBAE4|nr:flavin reductase family protein [Shouchella shacheensis]
MPTNEAYTFDPKELTDKNIYKLMTGSIVPRPIAWVSSKNKKDELNLAPFSFFTVASRKPPTLLISIGPGVNEREGTIKDTLTNIRETREYVINIVPEQLGQNMHHSSASVKPDMNEFTLAGVTPQASQTIHVPAVREAPIAFEIRLDQVIPIGEDHLVLGQVQRVRVEQSAYLGNYKINIDGWKPLARLAGNYAGLTDSYSLEDYEGKI